MPTAVDPAKRTSLAEKDLSEQLKVSTGSTGMWLAQGLRNRVDSGAFGDWALDVSRGESEHRGVALMDFNTTASMLVAARAWKTDALMIFILTSSRDGKANNNSLAVELYDVETGAKLFESKPLSTGKLITGLRLGKAPDAELATTVIEYIDEQIALHDAPQLTAAMVRERLSAIDSRKVVDPLAALIELRYFRAKKLISETAAIEHAAPWLGEDLARQAFSTDVHLRQEVVEALLAKRPGGR